MIHVCHKVMTHTCHKVMIHADGVFLCMGQSLSHIVCRNTCTISMKNDHQDLCVPEAKFESCHKVKPFMYTGTKYVEHGRPSRMMTSYRTSAQQLPGWGQPYSIHSFIHSMSACAGCAPLYRHTFGNWSGSRPGS